MLPILHQSLWRDEAFSVFLAGKKLSDIFLLITKDVQSPLYYFILHYWMIIFGDSEAVIRSLSVILHLSLGILVFVFVLWLTKNKIVATFTLLATIFNPFLLYYSFEVRPYSLLALLTSLALYLFFARKFILASIILSLAIFTHNFALLSFLGLIVYWVWSKRTEFRTKAYMIDSLKLFLFPIISIFFWATFVWGQWTKIADTFWIKPPTTGIFLQTFESFFGGPNFFEGRDFLLTIVFILMGFVIASWITNEKTEKFEDTSVFLFVSLAPIIISYLISSLWVPNFHERYVIASVPLLILFSAVSLHQLVLYRGKSIPYVVVSLLVLYLAFSVQVAEKIVRTPTKPPINYAVDEILKKAQEGDIIVPKDYLSFLETKYYVKRAGASIPVYALSSSGEIVWYANASVIDPSEIIREIPKDRRVWQVNPDGGYQLLE